MGKSIFDFMEANDLGITFYKKGSDLYTNINMHATFTGGDYAMSQNMLDSSERLGQSVIDLAKKQGVKLEEFDEIKVAMEYDSDGAQLNASELGAFLIGVAMQNPEPSNDGATYLKDGQLQSRLMPNQSVPDQATQLGIKLGQQVYGDNYENSRVDTKTSSSVAEIAGIVSAPLKPR